jgi:phosphoinositide-3-kinase regulatory subunit 4
MSLSVPDPDLPLQDLIKDMIALNPSARPSFDTLLHNARGAVFPEVFYSFLHGYVWSINEVPLITPFATVPTTGTSPEILMPATSAAGPATTSTAKGGAVTPLHTADTKALETAVPRDADHKIEKIWADYESVEPYLLEDIGEDTISDVRVDYAPVEAQGKPLQVNLSLMIFRIFED